MMRYQDFKSEVSPEATAATFLLSADNYRDIREQAHEDDDLLMSDVRSHHNGRTSEDKPSLSVWWSRA